MENQKVKKEISGIIREEVRKGRLKNSNEVLQLLPELLDVVCIDKRQMKEAVENCLQSGNPLNALLNIFGVQVIKKKKTINSIVNADQEENEIAVNIDDSYSYKWMTVNIDEMKRIVKKIADVLFKTEEEAEARWQDQKDRGDRFYDQYNELEKKYEAMREWANFMEQSVTQRAQFMLSSDKDNEQLIKLLQSMEIDVYWNAEETSLSDSQMFTEYQVEDELLNSELDTKLKPCMVRNGEVLLKGVRFVSKSTLLSD